jgi:hypothetical protein
VATVKNMKMSKCVIVQYYGMTNGNYIYTKIKVLTGRPSSTETSIQIWHPYLFHGSTTEMPLFALVCHGHGRRISAFEVTLREVDTLRVDWKRYKDNSMQSEIYIGMSLCIGMYGLWNIACNATIYIIL